MATDVGKVGMVMKGDWSSSVTYEELDVVTYNNSLYIATQSVPANTAPTNTTYWQAAVVSSILSKLTIDAEVSSFAIHSKNGFPGFEIISGNPSAGSPSVYVDFDSTGAIRMYFDTGSGYGAMIINSP